MQPTQRSRWPALLLLPLLALLSGCSDSFQPVVQTPAISPAGGNFNVPPTVTITDATPGASIFYTTDGSTPTSASTPYTAPFPLTQTLTVKAFATAPQDYKSFIATATFELTAPLLPPAAAPTYTPPAGTYTSAQSVTITDTTPNATIYYTTDGTTPTTSSTVYTAPVTVSTSETLNAIAIGPGYTPSPVATAIYSIQPGVVASFSSLTVLGNSIVMDPDSVFSSSELYQFGGTPATLALQFVAQPGLSMTFSATGKIACCTTINIGPDGQSGTFTMGAVGSISGFINPTGWPLVGVFTNGSPSGSPPAAYNYTNTGDSQLSYSPLLNQIFFIGDGLTGTGTGSVQTFYVPAGATELWLGIADVTAAGAPGAYQDNFGSFIVSGTLR